MTDPFTVPCPYCEAVAGQQCTNQVTGRPLRKLLAHISRMAAAEDGGNLPESFVTKTGGNLPPSLREAK